MPSSLTHYYFNKVIVNEDFDLKFLKNNLDLYLLGAQGPDPFFFYGYIPFKRKKDSHQKREFGTQIHKVSPHDDFNEMLKYANRQPKVVKDYLYSYIYGAFLHYLLDKEMHPYIFYKTYSNAPNSSLIHTSFETNIDVLLGDLLYKKEKTTVVKAIEVEKNKLIEVSKLYFELAQKNYDNKYITDLTFYETHQEMRKIEKAIYSKYGIKKFFFRLFFKNHPINSMSHSLKVKDNDKIDYLNTKKRKWRHPTSNKEFDYSIEEMINNTKKQKQVWKRLISDYYQGNLKYEELKTLCNNTNYDGFKKDEQIKYYQSVYNNIKGARK